MNRIDQRRMWAQTRIGDNGCLIRAASQDASFRTYHRISSQGSTQILMDAPPNKEKIDAFIHVQKLMRDAGVNVPKISAADEEEGFILMEDFGDSLYLDSLDESNVETMYGAAIESIHQMQNHISPNSLPDYSTELLKQELQLFIDWFIIEHLGETVTQENQNYLDKLFDILISNAIEQPQTFVHRDYHSRNLMVTQNRSPGILDFQDAVKGPVTYDLVSLLRDCYISWPEDLVDQLSNQFRKDYNAKNQTNIDSETWQRWFDLMGVQRHLKAIGIFCRLNYRDNKPDFLKDIARTMDYVIATALKQNHITELAYLLEKLLPKIDQL